MLYELVKYLENHFDIPGLGMWQYLSFRSVGAIILALLIGMIFGGRLIKLLRKKQIGEDIRNLGLEGQMEKKGTPTMGGIIILLSILTPILLLGDLSNIYTWLMIISTVWLGLLGFADDYIKVFRRHKEGLKGKFKIIGQVGLGLIVGSVMCFSDQVVVIDKNDPATIEVVESIEAPNGEVLSTRVATEIVGEKTTKTTIPFVKNNEFDYHWLVPSEGKWADVLTWILYVLVAIFVITAVSNGANLTDGLDGLNTGVSAIIAVVLSVLAYLSATSSMPTTSTLCTSPVRANSRCSVQPLWVRSSVSCGTTATLRRSLWATRVAWPLAALWLSLRWQSAKSCCCHCCVASTSWR